MKIVEIFWGEVKIDGLKGRGDARKREMIKLFARHQIVKATSGFYK